MKTIETTLAAYSEKLKPIEIQVKEGEGEVVAEAGAGAGAGAVASLPSHGTVLEIEKLARAKRLIRKQVGGERDRKRDRRGWIRLQIGR